MKMKKPAANDFLVDILFFGILLAYMLYYLPEKSQLHGFCLTPYFLRYSDFGFISRGLIGSILGIFYPYLSADTAAAFIFISQILLCIFVVVFLRMVRKRADACTRTGILFLSFVFAVNPGSVAFLFYWGNYGRFDLYMIAAAISCCMIVAGSQGGRYMGACLCICTATLMIHQGFIFSYFPCILSAVYMNLEENGKKKSSLILLFLCCSAVFLALQFGGKINGFSLQETIETVGRHTDYPVSNTNMLELEYFTPVLNFIPVYVLPTLKKNLVKCTLTIILLLPVEIMIGSIWRDFIKKTKRIYILIPLFIIAATLPKFIITCDYGRDFSSILISQFLVIFTVFAMGNMGMKEAVAEFQARLKKHWPLFLAGAAELALVGKFQAANILEITEKIVSEWL